MSKTLTRYSEAFKLQVVNELERGKLSGVSEAMSRYGISGGSTVSYWLQKYGKNHLLNKVVRVETTDERNQLKKLKKEVRELKMALADAHLDLVIEEGYLEMSCKAMGVSVDEYKKKVGTR